MFTRILILAPHPDDAELGCGGTIARLADEGRGVMVATLTDRDGNCPLMGDIASESENALEQLVGAARMKSGQCVLIHLAFPLFEMRTVRQHVLSTFERLRRELKPDAVFAPALGDLHQDHQVCMDEAARAFKGVTLLGYHILRSNPDFAPSVYVGITEDQLARKAAAVACYSTQRDKAYCQPPVLRAQAAFCGAQCGLPLAEAFSVRWAVMP